MKLTFVEKLSNMSDHILHFGKIIATDDDSVKELILKIKPTWTEKNVIIEVFRFRFFF